MKSTKAKRKQIEWWARGGGIARMGPYRSYARAAKALTGLDGLPVLGAFVWPEPIRGSRHVACGAMEKEGD